MTRQIKSRSVRQNRIMSCLGPVLPSEPQVGHPPFSLPQCPIALSALDRVELNPELSRTRLDQVTAHVIGGLLERNPLSV
jgi:hypothetical protein